MKLNRIEKALMNNSLRARVQQLYEAPLLERLGGHVEGGRILEVGCGWGIGVETIFRHFGAAEVHAFDLDPDMVAQARVRLAHYDPSRLRLYEGDVTAIPEPDESFDAVFDFGIIHHVPGWRKALAEVHRVLKPGGRFFFEEVTRQALARWTYRTFLEHPSEDRFSGLEFVAELERQGLHVGGNVVERFFGDFVIGVARKSEGRLA